jgi:hypothetical protein
VAVSRPDMALMLALRQNDALGRKSAIQHAGCVAGPKGFSDNGSHAIVVLGGFRSNNAAIHPHAQFPPSIRQRSRVRACLSCPFCVSLFGLSCLGERRALARQFFWCRQSVPGQNR